MKIRCQIKYKKQKERPKVDEIIKQLRTEGWRKDGPELHKEGIELHLVSMKKIIK